MAHGFAVFAGTTPEIIRASAREAERLGFASFWVNHPGSTDGLAALAHAARETRRVELGIGVIPLHTRGPESIVEGVKANALALDRLLLGVGSPNPEALKRVRAGVAELRAKLSTRLVVAALGPAAVDRLQAEAARYAAVPAYAANFARMGLKPVETAIAAQTPDAVQRGLAQWQGVVDDIIIRAITAKDTVEEHLALVRAAAPA